jgi:hypothetical protein
MPRNDTHSRKLDPSEHDVPTLLNVLQSHIVIIEDMAETGTFDAAVAMADCMRMRQIIGDLKQRFGVQPRMGQNVSAAVRGEARYTRGTQSWVTGDDKLYLSPRQHRRAKGRQTRTHGPH